MKILISTFVIWMLLTLFNYYFNYGQKATALWLATLGLLLVVAIFPLLKLIKGGSDNQIWLMSLLVLPAAVFLLSLQEHLLNNLIQKIDWVLLKHKRTEIISQIKNQNLALTTYETDSKKFKLPFNFPRVSTGGNDIWVSHNSDTKALSVSFPVKRDIRGVPVWKWAYTEDANQIWDYEQRINLDPKKNKKLEEGWYLIK